MYLPFLRHSWFIVSNQYFYIFFDIRHTLYRAVQQKFNAANWFIDLATWLQTNRIFEVYTVDRKQSSDMGKGYIIWGKNPKTYYFELCTQVIYYILCSLSLSTRCLVFFHFHLKCLFLMTLNCRNWKKKKFHEKKPTIFTIWTALWQ